MANTIRIKRRAAGGASGAPSTLENAELAFNEQDNTLYYGTGTGGVGGSATQVIAIAGPGSFTPLSHVGSGAGSHAPVTTGQNGFMIANDKVKLDGIAAGATNYSHPATHPPSIITQDSSARFVADTEKTAWNSKQPGDADLTAIAALTGTTGLLRKTTSNVWSLDTTAYSTFIEASVSAPLTTTGGNSPLISMPAATTGSDGYMTGVQANKLDGIEANANNYSHPLVDGAFHVPANGSSNNGKVLTAGETPGLTSWQAPIALSSTAPAALGAAAAGNGTTAARDNHVHAMPTLNALGAPTAAVALNSQRITGLADPTGAQDAATKNYVDSAIQGLDPKASARVATTAAGALNGGFISTTVIDGVTLATGDRILIKNQAAPAENGIYIVNTGIPTRATDANAWADFPSAYVLVEQGTVNAEAGFLCTSDAGGTLGTTAINFVQFTGAGQITVSGGITKTGNALSIGTGASGINLATQVTGLLSLANGGMGTNLSGIPDSTILKKSGAGFVPAVLGTDYLNENNTLDGGTF